MKIVLNFNLSAGMSIEKKLERGVLIPSYPAIPFIRLSIIMANQSVAFGYFTLNKSKIICVRPYKKVPYCRSQKGRYRPKYEKSQKC